MSTNNREGLPHKAREYVVGDMLSWIVAQLQAKVSREAIMEGLAEQGITLEELFLEASGIIKGLADLAYCGGELREWQFGEHCNAARQVAKRIKELRGNEGDA